MREENIPVSLIRNIAIGDLEIEPWLTALNHSNAAVRYWAAIRLGNDSRTVEHIPALLERATDSIPLVSIATARALCLMGAEEQGIPVLQQALKHTDEWVRLASALVLDEMQEGGRPALADLQSVMEDPNKYVVRVANHALNALQGTTHVVP